MIVASVHAGILIWLPPTSAMTLCRRSSEAKKGYFPEGKRSVGHNVRGTRYNVSINGLLYAEKRKED